MMYRILFTLLLHSVPFTLWAQTTIGLPDIVNYKKSAYNAGTQNWDIKQDVQGNLFFANNEGLLSFDGTYWSLYPLPNKTIVRSIEIGKEGRIYIGGQDEIGYFYPSTNGKLSYTSLKELLPTKDQAFADIWDIISWGDEVFFRSANKIFHLRNHQFHVYPASLSWLFIGKSAHFLLAQDAEKGLLAFERASWRPLIHKNDLPDGFQVTAAAPFGKDTTLLTTSKHGLYLLSGSHLTPFHITGPKGVSHQHFSAVVQTDAETFALGTYASGCYILNKQGVMIQHFTGATGLQNTNIRSLFSDSHKNLWLGLDNGVDFIAFNSAIKHINPASLKDGAGYAAALLGNQLYLGLSNGLFRLPLANLKDLSYTSTDFQPVPDTEGQIWGLSLISNHLLISKHDGLYQLDQGHARLIDKQKGFWTLLPFPHTVSPALVVAGNYQGLQLLEHKNNTFLPLAPLPNYDGSARFITIDNNNTIWTSHPYRGVYKIESALTSSPVVRLYTHKNGLPSSLNNHVYKVKNRVVIATEKGVYEYNKGKDVFEPSPYFRELFGEQSIRYLKEDPSGNIWFIHQKNLGVVDFSALKPQVLYLPELNGKMVSGFEHVFPIDENNTLIGAEKGFYHINYEKYKSNTRLIQVFIRTVEAIGKTDSLLFGGFHSHGAKATHDMIPAMGHQWNSFHIEFSSPLFEQQSNIEYSYYLKGFDTDWSEWSKKAEKDYTNLPAGTYTFQVKARNNLGNESAVNTYSFTVLPPWYQTAWAYGFYVALGCGLAYLLYKRQQRQLRRQQQKHLQEQQRLLYLHQLELEKSEKEIVKLRNEKLEAEIEFKNSELASTAMHLVQKGELLTKIKDELQRLNKSRKSEGDLDNLKKIIRILSQEEKINEDWDQFALHFNQVHSNFLITVKEKFPALSAHELKLCAYLRMNLTSKEMAQLMNISVRGVEISRYRLRKKLGIPTEVNLFQFLLEIQKESPAVKEPVK